MYLKNADLSSLEGWDYGDDGYKYTDYKTDGDVAILEFYNTWSSKPGVAIGHTRNFHFTQTVTLPAGSYRLAVSGFYREGSGNGTNTKAYLLAGDLKQYLVGLTSEGVGSYSGTNDLYKSANAFSQGDFTNELDFTLTEQTTITLGTRGSIDTTCSWCVLGPMKLYKIGNSGNQDSPFVPPYYSKEIIDGTDYWLYNAATGKYLGGANSWGTHSSLIEHGIPFKANKVGSNLYTLDSYTSNGGNSHFLGGEMIDQYPVNITILPNDNGSFSLRFDDSYLMASTTGTEVHLWGEETTEPYKQWYFISKNDLEKAVFDASADNPVDATFYIKDYNFSRNNTQYAAWEKTEGITNAQNPNNNGGANHYNWNVERFHNTFNMSQTISLPNGTYKLTAQGFYRQDGEDNENLPVFFANDQETTFPVKTGSENSMNEAAASFTKGLYKIEPITVEVTDHTLKVGAKNDTNMNLWCIWDNFELVCLGAINDINILLEEYRKALAEARELMVTNETISKRVLDFLQNTVDIYKEDKVDQSSLDALFEAVNAIKKVNSLAKTSIASYKIIASGEIPTYNLKGWNSEKQQGFNVNTWSLEGVSDGSGMVTPFIEEWVSKQSVLQNDMIYYTLEGLEPGEIYSVEALVRVCSEAGNTPNGPIFFVNDKETSITVDGTYFSFSNANGYYNGYYGTLSNVAEVGEDGKLTVGLKIENANYNWVSLKNVRISSTSEAPKETYAVLTDDEYSGGKRLSFYYDSDKSSHDEGTVYSLNEGANFPDWNTEETAASITTVGYHCDFEDARPTSGYCWFYEMGNLESIDDGQFLNTSEMTNMAGMFFYCSKLSYIGAYNFDTSKATNMWAMFYGCSALEELDVSGFNTSNVTDMTGMFCYCSNLTSLDLSSFDTSKSTSFNGMFYGCSGLTSLNLSGFDISSATDTQNMLAYCTGLKELTVSLSMQDLADGACVGIGTASSPCTIYAPAGFNFGVSTTGSYFQWKGGYFKLGAQTALLGDVNASGSVTLADAICEISWLLEQNPPVFVEAVADYNQDNVVSASDAIAIIQYVATVEPSPINPDVPDPDVTKILDELGLLRPTLNGFDLPLADLRGYTAFTMDVTLPDGETLASAKLGTHSVAVNPLGDNRYRIVAWSMDMAEIGSGATLHCTTTGGSPASAIINNIRIVDLQTREHGARAVECTPDGIRYMDKAPDKSSPLYRIDGTRIATPHRGIVIENGRKVVVRQ